jgi:chromosome segregation ATPase
MAAFVQQHLISILNPISEHVRSLESQVQRLRAELLSQSITVGTNSKQLSEHENQLMTLANSSTQTMLGMDRMRSELQSQIDLKAFSDKVEADRSILSQDLQTFKFSATQQFEDLRASFPPVEKRIEALERKAACHQSELITQAEDIGNIAQTVQQMTNELDDIGNGLEEPSVQHDKEVKNKLDKSDNPMARFGLRLFKMNEDLAKQATDCHEQVTKECQSLDEQVKELQQAKIGHDGNISDLFEGQKSHGEILASHGSHLKNLQKATDDHHTFQLQCSNRIQENKKHAEDNSAAIKDLSKTVTDNAIQMTNHNRDRIAQLETDVVDLNRRLQESDDRHSELRYMHEQLRDWSDSTDADIRSRHSSFQMEASSKLEDQFMRFAEVHTRFKQNESGLDATRTNVHTLNEQLRLTNNEVTRLSAHLKLSHEYLQGFGKGLQDVHRKVETGQENMLRPKDSARSRVLPSLPDSPQRPHTAMA